MKQPSIEEIKTEQSIFTDLWNLYKKYWIITEDTDWNEYIMETVKLDEKYKGTEFEKLYRDLILAVTNQLERNAKGANNIESS